MRVVFFSETGKMSDRVPGVPPVVRMILKVILLTVKIGGSTESGLVLGLVSSSWSYGGQSSYNRTAAWMMDSN